MLNRALHCNVAWQREKTRNGTLHCHVVMWLEHTYYHCYVTVVTLWIHDWTTHCDKKLWRRRDVTVSHFVTSQCDVTNVFVSPRCHIQMQHMYLKLTKSTLWSQFHSLFFTYYTYYNSWLKNYYLHARLEWSPIYWRMLSVWHFWPAAARFLNNIYNIYCGQ